MLSSPSFARDALKRNVEFNGQAITLDQNTFDPQKSLRLIPGPEISKQCIELKAVAVVKRACLNLKAVLKGPESRRLRAKLLVNKSQEVSEVYHTLSTEAGEQLSESEVLVLTVLSFENVNNVYECLIHHFQKMI